MIKKNVFVVLVCFVYEMSGTCIFLLFTYEVISVCMTGKMFTWNSSISLSEVDRKQLEEGMTIYCRMYPFTKRTMVRIK